MHATAGDLLAVLPSFPTKDLTSFHVESLLGGGGFSHVVLARDAAGAEWALKLIPANGATCLDEVDGTPLLLSEARIHLLLSQEPSVLPCHEAFKSVYTDERGGGSRQATYMAVLRMPVAACSVEEWLFSAAPLKPPCQGPPQLQVNESEVLGVWIQMVNAVHRCHTHGIIHKDIKLPNFLMDSRGKVQIMDFGLAQVEGVTPRLVVGTPWTMSPTALKHGDDGRAGDWWALGIVLYQLVQGGAWPFKQCWWPWQKGGGERMETAIRRAVLAGRIAFRDAAAVSEHVKALIRGLLQPDPNRRWQLRQVLANEAIRPEMLAGLAERFPELRPDMEALLQIQARARGVMAFGSDGGTPAGGIGVAGPAAVAAAAGNLLLRGAAAVSAVAAEGAGALHWPGGLRPGRAHGVGVGGAEAEGSYRPLLGDEGTRPEERSRPEAQASFGGAALMAVSPGAPAGAHRSPQQQSPARGQQQEQFQQQQQQRGAEGTRVDDLLFLLPDEVPRAHPSPPVTPRGNATSGTTPSGLRPGSATRIGEGPASTSGSQPLGPHQVLVGRQGSSPLAPMYRASPRGSRTSLQDLFGAGCGLEPQLSSSSPSQLGQPQLQQRQRTASAGLLGGLLGSASDLRASAGADGRRQSPRGGGAQRRNSWALQWQPTSLQQRQQQRQLSGGADGAAQYRALSGGGGGPGDDAVVEPLQLPQSSWVPPPPEVFAAGKFDRRSDVSSPLRTVDAVPVAVSPVNGGAAVAEPPAARSTWQASSPGPRPSPALMLSPSRRLLARARMLFTDCLRRPGVRHEAYDDDEYNSLAGEPR